MMTKTHNCFDGYTAKLKFPSKLQNKSESLFYNFIIIFPSNRKSTSIGSEDLRDLLSERATFDEASFATSWNAENSPKNKFKFPDKIFLENLFMF